MFKEMVISAWFLKVDLELSSSQPAEDFNQKWKNENSFSCSVEVVPSGFI